MPRNTKELQSVRSEGGLLPADLLKRVLDPKSGLPGLRPEDYGLPPGERLNEVTTQAWNRLRKHWAEFQAAAEKIPESDAGTAVTNEKWTLPLLRELQFGMLPAGAGPEIGGRTYPIARFSGPVPIHLVGCRVSLDRRAAGVRGAAVNPHGLVQEFLNRSVGHLWGVVSNGLEFRILRDNQALSRQAYLQFDLEAMFDGELYADFMLLWLVAHATRFAPRDPHRPDTCRLEDWTREADAQGARALGDLRGGVERALQVLGQGFTSHPRNTDLREELRSGKLTPTELHGELLRVVYRFIFLFVAEDRTLEGLPLLHPHDDSEAAAQARERYSRFYSTSRLREMAGAIKGSRHGDLWRQFNVVVNALSGSAEADQIRKHLALPTLGSFLWNPRSTSYLNGAELSNFDLLETLRNLAFTRQGKVLRPVDYRSLGAEELGGVYESLLSLTPQIGSDGATFTFAEFADNARKTSGSYYTPDSLVQCLLDSALDPVVEECVKGKSGRDAEQALLALKVCDPAVGSGHFLVGAAHRLARHLSRIRAVGQGESEPSPLLYQQALRDVIGRCLYGVDINPMAAELCRVGLWLEALEPGKPLSFLEHHIRVGNSLLGATPELIAAGVPDAAFKSMDGDDKRACSVLKRRNRGERDTLTPLFAQYEAETQRKLEQAAAVLEQLPDDRPEDVRAKELAFRRHEQTDEYRSKKWLADAWCAAFLLTKRFAEPGLESSAVGLTQSNVNALAEGSTLPEHLRREVESLAHAFQFFHWHLAFPEVSGSGGFDLVLGNPPWVRQELLRPFKQLLQPYRAFSSTCDASVYFLELALRLCRPSGRAAMLTPNKWFRASYAEGLRKTVRDTSLVSLVIDFGHSRNLFPDADTFPALIVLRKVHERVSDSEVALFVRADDDQREEQSLAELVRSSRVEIAHSNLREDRWNLEKCEENELLDRLLETGQHLELVLRRPILTGLKAGLNDAFYVSTAVRDELLSSDPNSRPLLKKFLRGRDVDRWLPTWGDQWHLVIASSQNRRWPWSNAPSEDEAERCFAETYPSIYAHLKPFEERLRARQDKGEYWWELRACDYYDEFEKPKVVVQCIAYYSQFAFDDEGHYVNNKAIVIPTEDLYILAILNSRITWWIVNRVFQHMKDDGLSVDVQFLRTLPVPAASEELREEIARQAKRLISARRSGADSDFMNALELALNGLVNRAFELTDSEEQLLVSSLPPRDPLNEGRGDHKGRPSAADPARDWQALPPDFGSEPFVVSLSASHSPSRLRIEPVAPVSLSPGDVVIIAHADLRRSGRPVPAALGTLSIDARVDGTTGDKYLHIVLRGEDGLAQLKLTADQWAALKSVGRVVPIAD